MTPCLFVANVIVCCVVFLFVLNSKFRNRLISEWQTQVQARLLSSDPKKGKRKNSSSCSPADCCLSKTTVTQRTTVEEDKLESETFSESQVGLPRKQHLEELL
ncbi:hypothetical protein JTE90_015293 [Oedothorax gibbosus]|uniref:Uncharacterized protein n=1 Tax=Oedothorax gibbosus TaxID=931172 RepID=A0AAV6VNB1_9ARAC|nr:hypothetical protein JTE90_015293 [Oedothorax gibbosus]